MKNIRTFEEYKDDSIYSILINSLENIISNSIGDVQKKASDYLFKFKLSQSTTINRNMFTMSQTSMDLQDEILDFIQLNSRILN